MNQVEELEEMIHKMADMDRKNTREVLELTNLKARLGRIAATKVITISLHHLSLSYSVNIYSCMLLKLTSCHNILSIEFEATLQLSHWWITRGLR